MYIAVIFLSSNLADSFFAFPPGRTIVLPKNLPIGLSEAEIGPSIFIESLYSSTVLTIPLSIESGSLKSILGTVAQETKKQSKK